MPLILVSVSMIVFSLILMYHWGLIAIPQLKLFEKKNDRQHKEIEYDERREKHNEEDLIL